MIHVILPKKGEGGGSQALARGGLTGSPTYHAQADRQTDRETGLAQANNLCVLCTYT